MDSLPPPLVFVVLLFAGWVNRQQQAVIEYLLEENRVLRAAHGPRRLRLADDQRRRLAVKGKVLGRRRLAGIAGIVTPDTILRWEARGQEIRWLEGATPWSPEHEAGPRRAGGPHGERKPDLGLHAHPRWAQGLVHEVARNTIKAILRITVSRRHRSVARKSPGRRSSPLIGTASSYPTRDRQRHDIESVVESAPKPADVDRRFQIAIRGSHEAKVDMNRFHAPTRSNSFSCSTRSSFA
jgi:hypothetical protein